MGAGLPLPGQHRPPCPQPQPDPAALVGIALGLYPRHVLRVNLSRGREDPFVSARASGCLSCGIRKRGHDLIGTRHDIVVLEDGGQAVVVVGVCLAVAVVNADGVRLYGLNVMRELAEAIVTCLLTVRASDRQTWRTNGRYLVSRRGGR